MNDTIQAKDKNGSDVAADVTARRRQLRTVAPPVDVLENADEVLLLADLPGVPEGAIDVQIENGTLTLQTRRPAPEDRSPALGREFEEVDYARTFRIPAGIETANIHAQAKNGTLFVHLPKAAAAKPRRVDVRAS